MSNFISIREHYDRLIKDLHDDPVKDLPELKKIMDAWDGKAFIDAMCLTENSSVLEIGVGTGRIAVKVLNKGCRHFTGIDFSTPTIARAQENLRHWNNVTLINDDFLTHKFNNSFDIIYSSLVFLHIEDKSAAVDKVANLLKTGGRFILSVAKDQNDYLDFKMWKVRQYPDDPEKLQKYMKTAGLALENIIPLEKADIMVAVK